MQQEFLIQRESEYSSANLDSWSERLNAEYVNKWLTLLANIGVLVGIIFLVAEIQQSNRIAIATTEISVRGQWVLHNEYILTNHAVTELLVNAADPDAKFSAVEVEKLNAFLYVNLNTWSATEIAYTQGMLPRATFELTLSDIREVLQDNPAWHPLVQETIDAYPSVADSHVYTAMRQALGDID
jgi:hypothetical protein